MGGRLMQPGSPQRVAINTNPEYCRPPDEEERIVMQDYARHALHCSRCRYPDNSRGLCERGMSRACDVKQYIYQKMGFPFSRVDKDRLGQTVRLEVFWSKGSLDLTPVKRLLEAEHFGLRISQRPVTPISRRRSLVIHQDDDISHGFSPSNIDRRPEANYVEIRPGGISEDRRQRGRGESYDRPSSNRAHRGSLYPKDMRDSKKRQSQSYEPIIVEVKPSRSYHR